MTVVDQSRQQAPRPPQPEPHAADSKHDLAREHGNRVAFIADLAEEHYDEAERELTARTQYEDGLQVLKWLLDTPWSERTLEIDQVLHDEHGSLSTAKAVEFIDLLLEGHSSMAARRTMLARQPRRAERSRVTRDALAEAREVSENLHRMAEAPRVQPALPAAAVPAPRNGTPLPRREPIAPALPPMFPPAPPESPAQTTSQMLAVLRDETAGGARKALSPKSLKALEENGFGPRQPRGGPDFGQPAPQSFAASALPQTRAGDTALMTPLTDEVLAHLDMDDASVEAPKPQQPVVPPFVAVAVENGDASSPAATAIGSGDGDA
jgi:hypothetical protein